MCKLLQNKREKNNKNDLRAQINNHFNQTGMRSSIQIDALRNYLHPNEVVNH